MTIRTVSVADLPELRRITVEGFDGTAIDQAVERRLGEVGGVDWRTKKARHVDEDVEANPSGVFVALDDAGEVLGYISTRLDKVISKGRIPNVAVDRRAQGLGIGRKLIEHALDYFRAEGMAYAMIETMDNNAVGQHLYPSTGFVEVARQIHFAMRL